MTGVVFLRATGSDVSDPCYGTCVLVAPLATAEQLTRKLIGPLYGPTEQSCAWFPDIERAGLMTLHMCLERESQI